jgi:hypothetical protein
VNGDILRIKLKWEHVASANIKTVDRCNGWKTRGSISDTDSNMHELKRLLGKGQRWSAFSFHYYCIK